MPKQPWTAEDEDRLVELRAQGLSWTLIGRELGRSEASVVGRFNKLRDTSPRSRRVVLRKPILRFPIGSPSINHADRVLANNRRLRAQLHELRWTTSVPESQLLHVRERSEECRPANFLEGDVISLHARQFSIEEEDALRGQDGGRNNHLGKRLADQTKQLFSEAAGMPVGVERGERLRRARQFEIASQINDSMDAPGVRPRVSLTDAENARRFRDKAAESLQMMDLAETESRRSALKSVVDHYTRTAEQLEAIAELMVLPKS